MSKYTHKVQMQIGNTSPSASFPTKTHLGSHLMSLGTTISRLDTYINRTLFLPTATIIHDTVIAQIECMPKVSRIGPFDFLDILPPFNRSVIRRYIIIKISWIWIRWYLCNCEGWGRCWILCRFICRSFGR